MVSLPPSAPGNGLITGPVSQVSMSMPSIAFPMPEIPRPDSFQRSSSSLTGHIATAAIYPKQSQADAFMANVLSDGTITKKGLMGEEKLGSIDLQGNYRLINGLSGNVFARKEVELSGLEENPNPFAMALQAAKQQRAIKGSEIPMIRSQWTSKGINGQGIKVGILDPLKKQGNQWKSSNHTQMVKQIIQDPIWGVAPGTFVEELGGEFENLSLKADNLQALRNLVVGDYVNLFSYVSQKLQSLSQQRDPALRILNMTFASDRVMNYRDLWNCLNAKDENQNFLYPNLRAIVFGPTLHGTREQQFQALINCYDQLLDNNSVVQKAYQQYVETTKKAAFSGLILVAGTANDHNNLPIEAQLKPGSEMNVLAKSPYVIRAGAASTNQTPGNYLNYSIAKFSSRGDGYWNPTIVAPGTEMGISFSQQPGEVAVDGTSFSTPFTCGVIAMMLQRNPWMTFEQVKAKLQSTATPLPDYQPFEQGAGILNVVRSVL